MDATENHKDNPAESGMDKLALRREARRKKILENAKSRLERLGVSQNEIKSDDYEQYSDPEVEMEIPAHLLAQQPDQMPQLQFNDLFGASMFSNSTSTPGTGGPTSPLKSRSIFIRMRLHLILMAAIALLPSIFLADISRDLSIFIPPGLLIIIELLFFREPKPLNPMVNLVLTMCGLHPARVNQFLNLFGIVHSLFADLGILVFFYCTTTCLLSYTSEQFTNLIVIN